LTQNLKNLQKGILTLLQASLDHLQITPPSHFTPRKVKGFVVGFTWLREGNNSQNNTLNLMGSQEENCFDVLMKIVLKIPPVFKSPNAASGQTSPPFKFDSNTIPEADNQA
jgi:hypothetical protein